MTTNNWWAGPPKRFGGPISPLSSTPTGWRRTLPNLRERTYDPFDITDEDYRELEEELLPYWKDKTMAVQWGHYVSQREWNRGQFGGVSDVSNYLCANGSHFIPAWTDVIRHGFVKYYEKAQRLLEALDPNDPESIDKRIFYTGILEVLEAIRDWGERLSAACARAGPGGEEPGTEAGAGEHGRHDEAGALGGRHLLP